MPKKALKDHIFGFGCRCQGHTSAVVPAEGIHGWCVEGMSASVPLSPRTIPKLFHPNELDVFLMV
jgi:hypothetical protein